MRVIAPGSLAAPHQLPKLAPASSIPKRTRDDRLRAERSPGHPDLRPIFSGIGVPNSRARREHFLRRYADDIGIQ